MAASKPRKSTRSITVEPSSEFIRALKPPRRVWLPAAINAFAVLVNVILAGILLRLSYSTSEVTALQQGLIEQEVSVVQDAGVAVKEQAKSGRELARLFAEFVTLLRDEELRVDRDEFYRVIEEARAYCRGGYPSPTDYVLKVHLDAAASLEAKIGEKLTATEYALLAQAGSWIWPFPAVEGYASKALRKSSTALERCISNLVLGHAHFMHSGQDPKADLGTGRKHFDAAISALSDERNADTKQCFVGFVYGFWAQHEAFVKNQDDAEKYKKLAINHWSKLRNRKTLEQDLEFRLVSARNGISPEFPCLPHIRGWISTPTLAPPRRSDDIDAIPPAIEALPEEGKGASADAKAVGPSTKRAADAGTQLPSPAP